MRKLAILTVLIGLFAADPAVAAHPWLTFRQAQAAIRATGRADHSHHVTIGRCHRQSARMIRCRVVEHDMVTGWRFDGQPVVVTSVSEDVVRLTGSRRASDSSVLLWFGN